jgi:hypothetical protein
MSINAVKGAMSLFIFIIVERLSLIGFLLLFHLVEVLLPLLLRAAKDVQVHFAIDALDAALVAELLDAVWHAR